MKKSKETLGDFLHRTKANSKEEFLKDVSFSKNLSSLISFATDKEARFFLKHDDISGYDRFEYWYIDSKTKMEIEGNIINEVELYEKLNQKIENLQKQLEKKTPIFGYVLIFICLLIVFFSLFVARGF